MAITFVIIFTICFFLVRLMPVDISQGPGKDPTTYEKMRQAYGYDKPLIDQYLIFIRNIFYPYYKDANGVTYSVSRFGYSWQIDYMAEPNKMLFSKMAPTVIINGISILISIPLGILIGIYMALKKNKWQDYVLSVLVIVLISVPAFVYAFILQYSFSYKLNLFPTTMPPLMNGMSWFSPSVQKAMVLPVIANSIGSTAVFSRFMRAELSETLTSRFMILARSKGMSKFEAVVKHGLRNSMVPIFPMILGHVIGIFSGSIIVEQVFGVPGVGKIFLDSILQHDYDVFLFVGMFYILIGLAGGLLADISYGLADPRIRVGGNFKNE
ncbi:MAG: ABC transporter permease [Bacilli bacterium]|nr:ABC transporter permease [Bacilli bacterium]